MKLLILISILFLGCQTKEERLLNEIFTSDEPLIKIKQAKLEYNQQVESFFKDSSIFNRYLKHSKCFDFTLQQELSDSIISIYASNTCETGLVFFVSTDENSNIIGFSTH